jgi:hypothetical protein
MQTLQLRDCRVDRAATYHYRTSFLLIKAFANTMTGNPAMLLKDFLSRRLLEQKLAEYKWVARPKIVAPSKERAPKVMAKVDINTILG